MSDRNLYSESWHRLAQQHIKLKPTLRIRKQIFRGETWFILSDPFTNKFFRFRKPAYTFLSMLNGKITLDDAWQNCLQRYPDDAPGQPEVIQLLAQLFQMNLIQTDLPADSIRLFERYKKHKQQLIKAGLISILFIKIPLWDPDVFLKKTMGLVKPFLGRIAFVLWCILGLFALKTIFENSSLLLDRSQEILAPDNLLWLLVVFTVLKIFHELGHAYFCRRYGGEVHTMGVMLLVFSPIPYVDTTSSWSFRERWKRVAVSFGGMYVELFIAAIATIVWANTGEGLINSLAYNTIFLASITTLAFNLNPLLRFDGYYILSDLTDTPNLHQRSRLEMFYYIERFIFGVKKAYTNAVHWKESLWLVAFGIAASIYRVFITVFIILFVADKFFGLGLIAAAIAVVGMLILPIFKLIKYLATEARLEKKRPRAVFITSAVACSLIAILWFVPFPNHFRAPGMLKTVEYAKVISGASGIIRETPVPSGQMVNADQLLIRMENPELDFTIQSTQAKLQSAQLLLTQAENLGTADLKAIHKRIEAIESQITELENQRQALNIRAPKAGIWVSSELKHYQDMQIKRGFMIGEVIEPSQFEFAAVVSQQESSKLFQYPNAEATIRLPGQAELPITTETIKVIPARQTILPTAALGWGAGGPIKIDVQEANGLVTAEPYFKVIAQLNADTEAQLMHGQIGYIRFTTDPQPLLQQWYRQFRQMLQSRYQI